MTDFQPNQQQLAAIKHTHGPAAFIAAAGTGKTAILVQRLVRLVQEEHIPADRILCVTFTRAAAEEMEKRALKTLKMHSSSLIDAPAPRVTTFHGLGHQMLREKLKLTPHEMNQKLINGEKRQWLAEDVARHKAKEHKMQFGKDVQIVDVLTMIDRAKEAMIPPEQSADFFAHLYLLSDVIAARYQAFYSAYEKTKQQQKLYDLADLLYIPLKLLEDNATFCKAWQNHFEYIQIDETQDTNPVQYQLIQILARRHQNVVVVGDPDQAIYQFRGASPESSILSFLTMYPQGKVYRIEENYRSTPQILAAANALIAHNPAAGAYQKVLRSTQPDGLPVRAIAYEDQEMEAEGITRTILKCVPGDYTWRDIFILARTHHHLASIELALAHHHVPYRTVGGPTFFKRRTTRDILAFLTLLEGMHVQEQMQTAQLSKREELNTPLFRGEQDAAFPLIMNIPSKEYIARTGRIVHGVPSSLLHTLRAYAGTDTILQFCDAHMYRILVEYQPAIKDTLALLRAVHMQCQNHPAQAIRLFRKAAYDQYSMRASTHAQSSETEEQLDDTQASTEEMQAQGRSDELDELVRIAERHHTIRHFLDEMSRLKEQSETNSKNKRDCVHLMTVHKAKGLESPVVFVAGMIEGIFPHRLSITIADDAPADASGIAEERRLAYVAYTRAKEQLILTGTTKYRGARAVPSRFIDEADLTPANEDGTLNPYFQQMTSIRQEQELAAVNQEKSLENHTSNTLPIHLL